jgi:hypothetical protein
MGSRTIIHGSTSWAPPQQVYLPRQQRPFIGKLYDSCAAAAGVALIFGGIWAAWTLFGVGAGLAAIFVVGLMVGFHEPA